jgi:sterol desaturase/sphingolipid hydroxylase (fatty acid hydroxylase superfamily)
MMIINWFLQLTTPTLCLILTTILFLIAERLFPGRQLPKVKGWYTRALLVNLAQFVITVSTAKVFIKLFGDYSLFHLSNLQNPILQGMIGWTIGTFFFYWWHRYRHSKLLWYIFHQVHHSPARLEVVTSFYKHPIEILSDSFLTAIVLYPFLGCSMEGVFWNNFFAATAEFFYHGNIKTPGWIRYFIQTPELHSIHHEYDVHYYNFSDLPIWDRLFGTYMDTTEFAKRCGFEERLERQLVPMLLFKHMD